MSYPSVLLHLDDDARADVRNEQVVQFAKRLGSHLKGLSCHRPVPTGAAFGAVIGGLNDALTIDLQHAQQSAMERERRFRALCDRQGLRSFDTDVDESEEASRGLLHRAPLHDLIVLGQPDPSDPEASRRREVVENVVLNNPRPTLLLPYAGRFEDFGHTALVAWDGSHGAARAVGDALGLLKRAEAVHVVLFDRRSGESGVIDQAPVRGVVRWLERHGVAADGRVGYLRSDIGNALLSHAADIGADLLVMGSWSRAPWTERLLGGATRTVMASMTVPVFTSH